MTELESLLHYLCTLRYVIAIVLHKEAQVACIFKGLQVDIYMTMPMKTQQVCSARKTSVSHLFLQLAGDCYKVL